MRRFTFNALLPVFFFAMIASANAGKGNRLTYLDGADPYYVSRTFPKLITPQWVGEQGVDAVVVLAIDDMRDHKRYENYLRPILNRLKKIDGRAPVSIMTNRIDPKEPHLQKWLKEGLSIEVHTYDHPCPFFKGGQFAKGKQTYDRCVDLLAEIPGSVPVAYRMPCCDSLNTPSPRHFAEIFNKSTANGNFLAIDTSVFQLFTANDPKLPRNLVLEKDGSERFRPYLPKDRTFVNVIEDYPYPYVIGGLCWQFPCMVPSDWEAQHRQRSNHPKTIEDWKRALDATVIKKGVFNMVFHPHGWIRNDQVVDFIDYADKKYGNKVKFLNFKETLERINKHLLGGQTLRHPQHGGDNGVRILDLNDDGYVDVVIGNKQLKQTRIWSPKERKWTTTGFPVDMTRFSPFSKTLPGNIFHFGVLQKSGKASFVFRTSFARGGYHFTGKGWLKDQSLFDVVEIKGKNVYTAMHNGADNGVRLRDLDGDGCWEMIVSNPKQQGIFKWSAKDVNWKILPFTLPGGATIVDEKGRDNGVRFVDVNEDGQDDVIFSNENNFGLFLFDSMKTGWRQKVTAGKRSDKDALPMIANRGTNNGFFVRQRSLWWSNESTPLLKDFVDRRSFNDLLKNVIPQAKSAQASLECIQPRPGFKVELMAAEPLVADPVAFAWGPDGKFWVVEMGDYPLGADGKNKHGGKVKFLQDTDGDGTYDKSTVFLDNLGYPTGVMAWKKGVLVTCAPEIFYAEDTDGDGKADVKKVLYSGFAEGNQQHRVNGLVWGLDNWIYVANGDSGGGIKSHKTGKTLNIGGRDLRIRPWNGDMEAASGQTQFGRNRDDWGNWFGCNNSNPMWHYVLADHYLRRNPHFAPPSVKVQVSVNPGAAQVFPISRPLPRFNNPNSLNRFTSACSAMVYRDNLFGPAFTNNTFVSEPVHNLVHREIMKPKGYTFTSRRTADEENSEFLASSDNWFRPTMIQTGPDGALWVADMYRFVIEHPQWIPKDWQQRLDLRAGHDKGRIYRIYPVGKKARQIPRLDKLTTAQLVGTLDSPNGWQRDMAQMVLVMKKDQNAVRLLETMAVKNNRPLARLHAMCTLYGFDKYSNTEVLQKCLTDLHPAVRRHAIRVYEPFNRDSRNPFTFLMKLALGPKFFTKMTDDPDPQVRIQMAYSLENFYAPEEDGKALARLLLAHGKDQYLRAAAMSSINKDNIEPILLVLLEQSRKHARTNALFEDLVRIAQRQGNKRVTVTLLETISQPAKNGTYVRWQFSALAGLLDSLEQRKQTLKQIKTAKQLETNLAALFSQARQTAKNRKSPEADRLPAIRLLGRGLDNQKEDVQLLAELLSPQNSLAVQRAAVDALGNTASTGNLLKGWKSHVPAIRSHVLDVLLTRPDGANLVLGAIDKKQILSFEIDAIRRQRLLQHRTASIRNLAKKLFAATVNADRKKVFAKYREAAYLKGEPLRGKLIFEKNCAACHKLGDLGQPVGPDLAALSNKSRQSLLMEIIDPNRAVEAKYVGYLAVAKNGKTHSGVLAEETSNSITLVANDGKKQTILRADLDELFSTGKSAMPEGLEKDITVPQMANLIEFIRSNIPAMKRKVFPGNSPTIVKSAADGSLLLTAKNCGIYGPSIVFEKKYGNLGYWSSPDDRAVWQVEPSKAGKYTVWIDFACAPEVTGNAMLIECGFQRLMHKVPSTGSWDIYNKARIGELQLPEGKIPVIMRSLGKIRGAMIDLKSIRLIPQK